MDGLDPVSGADLAGDRLYGGIFTTIQDESRTLRSWVGKVGDACSVSALGKEKNLPHFLIPWKWGRAGWCSSWLVPLPFKVVYGSQVLEAVFCHDRLAH